jgi:hypothetical protein
VLRGKDSTSGIDWPFAHGAIVRVPVDGGATMVLASLPPIAAAIGRSQGKGTSRRLGHGTNAAKCRLRMRLHSWYDAR